MEAPAPHPSAHGRLISIEASSRRKVLKAPTPSCDIRAARAARAAGCSVAAVVYGYTPETSLRAFGPDWVISNLQELPSLEVQAARCSQNSAPSPSFSLSSGAAIPPPPVT